MITLLQKPAQGKNIHIDTLTQFGLTTQDFRGVEYFKVEQPGLPDLPPGIYKVRHVDSYHVYSLFVLDLPEPVMVPVAPPINSGVEEASAMSEDDITKLFEGEDDENISELQGSDTGDQEGSSGDGDSSAPPQLAGQKRRK